MKLGTFDLVKPTRSPACSSVCDTTAGLRLVQRGSVDRPAVFTVPPARRHASPRLVACICRDAGAFCSCLNRSVGGEVLVRWMHRSPCGWTVRIDR
jgi:hypothetical protein